MKKSILALSIILLTGCGDESDAVKKAYISATDHYTYDSVLSNRPVCSSITWKAYTVDNVKYVDYSCNLNKGKALPVFNEDEKNTLAKNAKKEYIDTELKIHEDFLASVNETINQASAFIGEHWDSLDINQFTSKKDNNNIYYWEFEDIKMSKIIDDYISTTNEGAAYQEAIRKYNKLKLLSNVDLAEEKRKLAASVIPLYIKEIKELLKVREDTFIANQKEFPEEGTKYVNEKVNQYIKTHPTSYQEHIIWGWNKLDNKYEINEGYKEVTWSTGEVAKGSLCLKDIIYSVTHNLNTIDRYNEYFMENKSICKE